MALTRDDGFNRNTPAPAPARKLPVLKDPTQGPRLPQVDGARHDPAPRAPAAAPRSTKLPEPEWTPALALRGPAVGERDRANAAREKQEQQHASMIQAMTDRARQDGLRKTREANDRKETGSALTASQWASYTPEQQAAVQSNADLADAIKRDLANNHKNGYNASQLHSYNQRVNELFGEDGSVGVRGLDYAPNTVAFLNERGITKEDLAGKSLDDVIQGDTLLLTEDIDAMKDPAAKRDAFHVGPQPGTREGNVDFARRLAAGQAAYQEKIAAKLEKGQALLSGVTSSQTNRAATETYGARPAERMQLPAVRPETAAQIDLYMEALARSDSPIDKAMNAISLDLQQRGATPEESDQVYQALLERANQGATGQGKWFDGIDFPMRSPIEVAQALGVPSLKRLTAPAQGAR